MAVRVVVAGPARAVARIAAEDDAVLAGAEVLTVGAIVPFVALGAPGDEAVVT